MYKYVLLLLFRYHILTGGGLFSRGAGRFPGGGGGGREQISSGVRITGGEGADLLRWGGGAICRRADFGGGGGSTFWGRFLRIDQLYLGILQADLNLFSHLKHASGGGCLWWGINGIRFYGNSMKTFVALLTIRSHRLTVGKCLTSP